MASITQFHRGSAIAPALLAAVLCIALTAGAARAQEAEQEPRIPIHIDDSPTARDMVATARELVEKDRPLDAVRTYQKLIEQFPFKLMAPKPDAETYADALVWVTRALRSDPALLELYQRQYEPAAQRALDEASEPPIDPRRLLDVMQRYALCESGLEAGLRLTAVLLARADYSGAAAVIDQLADHPARPSHDSRYHLLQTAVGLYADQPDRLKRHREALAELPDAQRRLAQLKQWQEQLNRPPGKTAHSPLNDLPTTTIPPITDEPRWQIKLTGMRLENGSRVVLTPSRTVVSSDNSHPLIPVVAGDRLLINDSTSVIALDRSSRFELWRYEAPQQEDDEDPAIARVGTNRVMPDQRGVAVGDGRAVAVIGRAPNWPWGWRPRAGTTSLACLDLETGEPLWSITPGDLEESLANAYFHGTPVVDGGRVYCLIRRSAISNFQDAYIVSIDLHSGELNWRRYLSSSIAQRWSTSKALPHIVFDNGRLYVSDHLGSIAALSGFDGRMIWLRKLPEDMGDLENAQLGVYRNQSGAWRISAPVRVAAGLVAHASRPGGATAVLDADTGEVKRDLSDPLWLGAVYLAPAGDDLLLVGRTVALIDGQTLEPKWQRNLGEDTGATPLGLPSVTPNYALIPTPNHLFILRMEDGSVASQVVISQPGNVLALDGQVLLAGGMTVRSYMSWPQVYGNLKRLIQENPQEPTHGLALAEAAFAAEQWQAGIEGVDDALAAMQRFIRQIDRDVPQQLAAADTMRNRVFKSLLVFAESRQTRDQRIRRIIFDRLAEAASGPSHDVAYQLALGDFLVETNEPVRAADHFQAVLVNPTLSTQLYERSDGSRQAGLEARMRLSSLIKKHGPKVYAKYESEAADLFVNEKQKRRPDLEALNEIAERYPLARTVPEALLLAADTLAADGETEQAIGHLRQAYRQMVELRQVYDAAEQAPLAQNVVGRLAQWYLKLDQPWRARHWLRRLNRDYPDLPAIRDGQPVPVDDWLASLSDGPGRPGGLPSIKLPLQSPTVIPGRLVTPTRQPPANWPRDRIVTRTPDALQLRSGPNLATQWQMPVGDGDVELLSLTDEQAVLWFGGAGSLVALDAESGKPIWQQLDIATLLTQVGRPAQEQIDPRQLQIRRRLIELDAQPGNFAAAIHTGEHIRLNGRLVGPTRVARRDDDPEAQPLFIAFELNETVIIAADALGRTLGIDRHSGEILWRRLIPTEEITHLHAGEETIIIVGVTGRGAGSARWTLLALDPFTGDPTCPPIQEERTIYWVGLGGEHTLLYGTPALITGRSTVTGGLTWQLPVKGPQPTAVGFAEHDLAVFRDTAGRLHAVNPRTGQRTAIVETMGDGGNEPMDLRIHESNWHIVTPTRAVMLAPDGQLQWRDAVAEMPPNFRHQLVGESHVALLRLSEAASLRHNRELAQRLGGNARLVPLLENEGQIRVGGAAWYYRLHLLDRHSGAIVQERTIGPMKELLDPTHAVFLDNRLVLTTGTATVVIEGAE